MSDRQLPPGAIKEIEGYYEWDAFRQCMIYHPRYEFEETKESQ